MSSDTEIFIDKIHCDIFYSSNDITALRWLTELKQLIIPYQDFMVLNYYETDSPVARKVHVYSDCILLNSKKVTFTEANKMLFEFATQFTNTTQELVEQEQRIIKSIKKRIKKNYSTTVS